MTMDEAKESFCNEYCRFLYENNSKLKYMSDILCEADYLELVEKVKAAMSRTCDKCPLNNEIHFLELRDMLRN